MTPYEEVLLKLAQQDERIVVLTAENRAAIRSLPALLGERFIDVGICEQTLLGVAAGLAARGRRPIVHALAAFLTMRGFEFIRTDIGIGQLPVILVGGVPGLLSDGNGPTHQAIEDIALMRSIRKVAVVTPMDRAELVTAIPTAIAYDGPCYLRYYDRESGVTHDGVYDFGVAEVHGNPQSPVAIVSAGLLVTQALLAQQELAQRGVATTVINMRTIEPLDEATILKLAAQGTTLVLLEDHLERGGLFSAVSECLAKHSQYATLLPMNLGHDWFRAGQLPAVLEETGLSAAQIVVRILTYLEKAAHDRNQNSRARLPEHHNVEFPLE